MDANILETMLRKTEEKRSFLSVWTAPESLSEKCLDLEGGSKQQNLRVARIKEGNENSQKPREFVARLLKEVLNLTDATAIDQAHRALRKGPRNDEPPWHFIARLHYCRTSEDITHKASPQPERYSVTKPGVAGVLFTFKATINLSSVNVL